MLISSWYCFVVVVAAAAAVATRLYAFRARLIVFNCSGQVPFFSPPSPPSLLHTHTTTHLHPHTHLSLGNPSHSTEAALAPPGGFSPSPSPSHGENLGEAGGPELNKNNRRKINEGRSPSEGARERGERERDREVRERDAASQQARQTSSHQRTYQTTTGAHHPKGRGLFLCFPPDIVRLSTHLPKTTSKCQQRAPIKRAAGGA